MITKQEQAKNGFKTFIITLSVSLVIFSSVYYLLGNFTDKVDIEDFDVDNKVAVKENKVKGTPSENLDENPFEKLNNTSPQVLAGIDETEESTGTTTTDTTTATTTDETEESTESAVPETGSTTLIGSILSIGFFSLALFVILSGPRKTALSKFENSMLRD